MIVFCAGLRSSASTLQWQIAKHIVEAKNLGFGFIRNRSKSLNPYLHTNKIVIIKQHKLTNAKYIRNSDAIVLMTVRDLRDVQCSLMQRWQKPFSHCLKKLRVYVDQQQEWINRVDDKVYIVQYEFLVSNTEEEIKQTAIQIGINIDTQLIQEIAIAYSPNNNKQRLSKNHITDARIGKYKNLLTKEQISVIDNEFENWFVDYGYK